MRAILTALLAIVGIAQAHASVPTSTKLTLELTPAGIDTRWPTNAAWILATTGLQFANIPDLVVANGATGSFNIRAPYLTDVVGGATLAANCSSALPTGGFSLTTNGVDYASTTTTDITCTFTAMRSPFVAISNSVRIASAGTPSADTYAPTIPIGLTCTSGTTGQIPCTVSPPRDPRTGTSWSGIDHLQYSVGGVATATIAALPGSQYTFTDTQIGVDPASTTFTGTDPDVVIGAGGDVDATTDIVAFRNTPVTGDFVATIKVNGITSTSNYNKCGLMIRETNNDNAAMLVGHVQKSAAAPLDVQLRGRASTAANVGGIYGATISAVPYWVRIARVGNVFTEYGSTDGNAFTSLATANYSIASTVYVGPYGTGSGTTEVTCDLQNFTLTQDPVLSFVYNDASTSPTAKSIAVRAYDKASVANVSAYGAAVSATAGAISDVTAPSTPANTTASANGSQTQINFSADVATDASGIRGYIWSFSATSNGTYVDVAEQVGVAYTLTGLSGSTTRYGKVKAVDNAGNVGSYSTTANATTASSTSDPTTAVASITVTPNAANPTTTLDVCWSASANTDHYRVKHSASSDMSNAYVQPEQVQGLCLTTNGNGTQIFGPTSTFYFDVAACNAAETVCYWRVPTETATGQPGTTASTTGNAINWHTGHYVIVSPNLYYPPSSSTINTHYSQITEICSHPEWKGIQLYMYWGAYEGATAGDYSAGRTIIDNYLTRLEACGKHLILSIVYANYTSAAVSYILPAYLYAGCTLGGSPQVWTCPGSNPYGVTAGNSSGRILGYSRFWQQATMDRYIATMQDIGTQFGNRTGFEMVSFWELLVPGVATGTDGWSESAMSTQAIRWLAATRAAMPKQQVRLGVNYWTTDTGIVTLLQACAQYSCSWGGPEVLALGSIQANQVYRGYLRNGAGTWVQSGTDYSGIIPYIGETEWKESSSTANPTNLFGRANADYSAPSFVAVKPSYFSWAHDDWELATYPFKDWATSVRPFVESTSPTHPIQFTTCPTSFPSCNTN